MAKSQVKGRNRQRKSLHPNAGTEARLPYLLTAVAGGFAVTLVRNETQRHSAALKNAGQKPIGLLPLDCRYSRVCEPNINSDLRLPLLSVACNRPKTGTHLELSTEFHFSTRKCWNGYRLLGSKSLTCGNVKRLYATEFTSRQVPPDLPVSYRRVNVSHEEANA